MKTKVGIGQDSHRFLAEDVSKPCILAGVLFDEMPGFDANSDGDVVYHAICNAITSVTGKLILGDIADDLCLKDGITDSRVYVMHAVETLGSQKITHVAISIEGKRPQFYSHIKKMRENIANCLNINFNQVGITATSGEGLSSCGCGDGVACTCIITIGD